MVEGSDIDISGKILHCFGENVDTCCGNSGSAPVMKAFSMYVDLVRLINCQCRKPGWKQSKLVDLEQRSKEFKGLGKRNISQLSSFKPEKFQVVRPRARSRLSETYQGHGIFAWGIVGKFPQPFQTKLFETSTRKETAMHDAMKNQFIQNQ